MLKEKIKTQGIGCLYEGSLATVGSTFVGHYPWFVTFNTLQAMVIMPLPLGVSSTTLQFSPLPLPQPPLPLLLSPYSPPRTPSSDYLDP